MVGVDYVDVHLMQLLRFSSLCDVVAERTFSIVKRFDALFRLTPYYMKQRRALQLLQTETKRVRAGLGLNELADHYSFHRLSRSVMSSRRATRRRLVNPFWTFYYLPNSTDVR